MSRRWPTREHRKGDFEYGHEPYIREETRAEPGHPDALHYDDGGRRSPFSLLPVMTGEYFKRQVSYGVIVESWDRVGRCGSKRRRYNAAFTEAERRVLGKYHQKFYKWEMRTGTPRRVAMRLATLRLLQRACEFFASI